MTAELQKAINDGINKYKAYQEGDKILKELGSLEQAKKDLTKTNADLQKQNEALGDFNRSAIEIIENAKAAAEKIVSDAKVEANGITDNAKKKAEAILDKASKELKGIESEIERKQLQLSSAVSDADKATDAYSRIKAELDSIQAKAKKLLGD